MADDMQGSTGAGLPEVRARLSPARREADRTSKRRAGTDAPYLVHGCAGIPPPDLGSYMGMGHGVVRPYGKGKSG